MIWQSNCITYRGGYKYQTEADYAIRTGITPEKKFSNDYLAINVDGHLTIKKGYAWDGPSGPTIDTRNFMRGSLVHDALYQLMREKALDSAKHRPTADRLLQAVCEEDGMSRLRAWWNTGLGSVAPELLDQQQFTQLRLWRNPYIRATRQRLLERRRSNELHHFHRRKPRCWGCCSWGR